MQLRKACKVMHPPAIPADTSQSGVARVTNASTVETAWDAVKHPWVRFPIPLNLGRLFSIKIIHSQEWIFFVIYKRFIVSLLNNLFRTPWFWGLYLRYWYKPELWSFLYHCYCLLRLFLQLPKEMHNNFYIIPSLNFMDAWVGYWCWKSQRTSRSKWPLPQVLLQPITGGLGKRPTSFT